VSIPFTQYLMPDGRKRDELVDRPSEIEALAQRFIAAGGKYECEVLGTGHVSITACHPNFDDEGDIAIKVCSNGPAVLAAVDEVVKNSVTWAQEKKLLT
jgi:hypothetical protein